jgi:hypothetical protein
MYPLCSEKELEAVLNVLSLLTCIHQYYSVTHSKIDVYCLLKATTRLMRGLLYPSVSSALDDHGDLLAELSYILQIPCSKSKIHYKYLNLAEENGSPIPLRYISQLGTDISSHSDEINAFPRPQDYISPSCNTIQLRYKDRPLLTKIKTIISRELYSAAIQDTICKQEDWTSLQFHSIDWDALEYAFSRAWSCKRITYTKLTHKLLNTNVQNHKFSGRSALCPCCTSSPETLTHMLSCPSTEVAAFRLTQQEILWQQLSNVNTPEVILQAIKTGVLGLGKSQGPVSTSLPLVTEAVEHQFTLGWEAFLRGRISCKWRTAYSVDTIPMEEDKASLTWAGLLVGLILNYSQQLWAFRCGVLHGHTKEKTRKRHREELIQNICIAYEEYEHDPFCIPSDWRKLFDRPFGSLTTSDRDTLTCWLRSYSEAKQQQALLLARQPLVETYLHPIGGRESYLVTSQIGGQLNNDIDDDSNWSSLSDDFSDLDVETCSIDSSFKIDPFPQQTDSLMDSDIISKDDLDTG